MARKLFVSFGRRRQVFKDISKNSLIRQQLERFGGPQKWNRDLKTAAFVFFTQKGIQITLGMYKSGNLSKS